MYLDHSSSLKVIKKKFGYLVCKEWGNGVADLGVLAGTWTAEKVVVWEGLNTGGFAYRKTAALCWIMMNEVMSILGNMTGHRGGWTPL